MSKNVKIKPGKQQSGFGMVAGIIFCIIGVVIVIPTFGLFGIIWTLFALGITVMNGMNAFSDKGVPTHEIIIDESDSYETKSQKASVEERLKLIQELYNNGDITAQEYEDKRKKILDEI